MTTELRLSKVALAVEKLLDRVSVLEEENAKLKKELRDLHGEHNAHMNLDHEKVKERLEKLEGE